MKLSFKYVNIDHHTWYPGEEDGGTQVLVLRARLTPPLAEELDCRVQCYTDLGVPLRNFEKLPLTLTIQTAEVTLSPHTWLSSLVHKFCVQRPKSKASNEISLEVSMRLHFAGAVHLADWCKNQNKSEFDMVIHPPEGWSIQQSLLLTPGQEDKKEPDEFEEPLCIACENQIPISEGSDPPTHLNGLVCMAAQIAEDEAEEAKAAAGGTLAPAVTVVGGTHQRRRRKETN